ncbi:hypothetical protein IJG14_01360, partial [bacterium]|nr:hypothetical protein [bacterium]
IKYVPIIDTLLKEGKAHVIISIDSGCEETYKKIKQVNSFKNVLDNMKKYSDAAKEGNCLFESKYIIIPEINNNKEEILKWFDICTDIGVKTIAIDFETNFLKDKPNQIPANINELLNLIQKTANDRNIQVSYWNYLEQLLFGLEKGIYKIQNR